MVVLEPEGRATAPGQMEGRSMPKLGPEFEPAPELNCEANAVAEPVSVPLSVGIGYEKVEIHRGGVGEGVRSGIEAAAAFALWGNVDLSRLYEAKCEEFKRLLVRQGQSYHLAIDTKFLAVAILVNEKRKVGVYFSSVKQISGKMFWSCAAVILNLRFTIFAVGFAGKVSGVDNGGYWIRCSQSL